MAKNHQKSKTRYSKNSFPDSSLAIFYQTLLLRHLGEQPVVDEAGPEMPGALKAWTLCIIPPKNGELSDFFAAKGSFLQGTFQFH